MTSSNNNTIVIKQFSMSIVRETKGTVLYAETAVRPQWDRSHNMYIMKDQLPRPFPKTIVVTIEVPN